MEPETVLVTGAAGFIGSHLTEDLLAQGVEVHGVDCLTDYYSPGIKRSNIQHFEGHPDFTFHEENIVDLDLASLLPKVDAVFHMAAQAGVRASWGSEFDEYVDQNIRATQKLLEAMKNHTPDVPMVLASSSSVYGIPEEMPMHEDMKPNPYSPYGVTKLATENLGMLYNQNFDLPVVAHRFFTVYGPRQRPDMAFSRFLTWVYRGEKITVYGDGSQTRDFSYVKDVTRAVIESLKQEAFGEVYNIGGGNRVSVTKTLETIEAVSGETVHTRNEPMPEGDVPHTDADTSKIREDLGWEPSHTLEEGLARQWEWIRGEPAVRESIPAPGS
jgi:UDP-glucose 4-epimerase